MTTPDQLTSSPPVHDVSGGSETPKVSFQEEPLDDLCPIDSSFEFYSKTKGFPESYCTQHVQDLMEEQLESDDARRIYNEIMALPISSCPEKYRSHVQSHLEVLKSLNVRLTEVLLTKICISTANLISSQGSDSIAFPFPASSSTSISVPSTLSSRTLTTPNATHTDQRHQLRQELPHPPENDQPHQPSHIRSPTSNNQPNNLLVQAIVETTFMLLPDKKLLDMATEGAPEWMCKSFKEWAEKCGSISPSETSQMYNLDLLGIGLVQQLNTQFLKDKYRIYYHSLVKNRIINFNDLSSIRDELLEKHKTLMAESAPQHGSSTNPTISSQGDQYSSVLPVEKDSYEKWWRHTRPTCEVLGLTQDQLPLRVLDVEHYVNHHTIRLVRPLDWNFVIISHTWKSHVQPWIGPTRPWPATKYMSIMGFSKLDLLIAAQILVSLGARFCWIDNVCIDQDSSLELQREINRMGDYYKNARKCYIFPRGLGSIGGPTGSYEEGLPRWYSRAWTLQELAFGQMNQDCEHIYVCDRNTVQELQEGKVQAEPITGNFTFDQNLKVVRIPHKHVEQAILLKIQASRVADSCLHQEYYKASYLWRSMNWTKLQVLRLLAHRNATREEDKVYGGIGLLGLSGVDIRYGKGIKDALLVVAEVMHVDQRLLLAAVEGSAGEWIDGFCAVPCMQPEFSAWGVEVSRVAGQATFMGHRGMEITSLMTAPININTTRGERALLGQSFGHTSLGQSIKLNQSIIGYGYYSNSFDPSIGTSLIMIGKSENTWDGQADPNMLPAVVMLCQQAGSVLHKVGLGVVDTKRVNWKIGRVVVA